MTPTKQQVTLRLDRDVLNHFRAMGTGWQSRINEALRKVSGLNCCNRSAVFRLNDCVT